jgi:predicted O-methyltransferase YrrM
MHLDVPGYTPHDLCRYLASLAGQVPADRAIVEVGVYKGRTACYLGAGARSGCGAHVTAVDPWDLPGARHAYVKTSRSFTAPEIRQTADRSVARHGLSEIVTLVRGFSTEVAAGWAGPPVGLLFVDGDHTRAGLSGDLDAWGPRLAPGATLVIDDYQAKFPEVMQLVDELAARGVLANPEVRRTAKVGREATFAVTRFP